VPISRRAATVSFISRNFRSIQNFGNYHAGAGAGQIPGTVKYRIRSQFRLLGSLTVIRVPRWRGMSYRRLNAKALKGEYMLVKMYYLAQNGQLITP
jgi:hypothetical protein